MSIRRYEAYHPAGHVGYVDSAAGQWVRYVDFEREVSELREALNQCNTLFAGQRIALDQADTRASNAESQLAAEREKVARLEKDAARYVWLKENSGWGRISDEEEKRIDAAILASSAQKSTREG